MNDSDLRISLEKKHGPANVYDAAQLDGQFELIGFLLDGLCVVVRKSDRLKGFVQYDGQPRLFYNFRPL